MAVGLTASAASILKAVFIQKWVNDTDGMFVGFTICTLAAIEMLVGSIAACLPCLKSTVQGLLIRCGVDFSSGGGDLPSFVRAGGEEAKRSTFEELWMQDGKKWSSSYASGTGKSATTQVEETGVEVQDTP